MTKTELSELHAWTAKAQMYRNILTTLEGIEHRGKTAPQDILNHAIGHMSDDEAIDLGYDLLARYRHKFSELKSPQFPD